MYNVFVNATFYLHHHVHKRIIKIQFRFHLTFILDMQLQSLSAEEVQQGWADALEEEWDQKTAIIDMVSACHSTLDE